MRYNGIIIMNNDNSLCIAKILLTNDLCFHIINDKLKISKTVMTITKLKVSLIDLYEHEEM